MQPNIEIETPIGKHKVVIKNFVSGGDEQAIKGVLQRGIHYEFETQPDGSMKQKPILDGLSLTESNNKAIEVMVLTVNGNSDDVVGAVLAMDRRDTAFVTDEVNKVTRDAGLGDEKKKRITEQSILLASNGSGSVDEELYVAMVLEKTHWTYQQYLDQPLWLLDALASKWEGEAEHARVQAELRKQKANGGG